MKKVSTILLLLVVLSTSALAANTIKWQLNNGVISLNTSILTGTHINCSDILNLASCSGGGGSGSGIISVSASDISMIVTNGSSSTFAVNSSRIVDWIGNWSADKPNYVTFSVLNGQNNYSLAAISANIGNWSADKGSYVTFTVLNGQNNYTLQQIASNVGNFTQNASTWMLCGSGNFSRWNGTGFSCSADQTGGGSGSDNSGWVNSSNGATVRLNNATAHINGTIIIDGAVNINTNGSNSGSFIVWNATNVGTAAGERNGCWINGQGTLNCDSDSSTGTIIQNWNFNGATVADLTYQGTLVANAAQLSSLNIGAGFGILDVPGGANQFRISGYQNISLYPNGGATGSGPIGGTVRIVGTSVSSPLFAIIDNTAATRLFVTANGTVGFGTSSPSLTSQVEIDPRLSTMSGLVIKAGAGQSGNLQEWQNSSGMTDSIASMRWENDPMIINLRIRLGGYKPVMNQDGQTLLQRDPETKGMVNDIGIDRFVAIVHGVVNPVVALSNIDDEEANTLIRQILYGIIRDIVYNQKRYEIHPGDKNAVMTILKSLVFMQLKRPVAGHEAKNFRTQTIEQNMSQQMSMPQRQSSPLNPFSWGSKK